jgi:transcriptional regulator with XRE-family HTH domain
MISYMHYNSDMSTNRAKNVFIRNLVFIMDQNGLTYSGIDKMKKRPCSGRYVAMLVKGERSPNIEIVGELARALNVSPADLLNPTFPEEYAEANNLAEVVKLYLSANEEGRKHILSSAAIAPKKPL